MSKSSSDSDSSSSRSKHKKHHKRSRSKDESKKRKIHKKHHHHHRRHHKHKDKKNKKALKKQEQNNCEQVQKTEEFEDQQLKIQLHAQALIQAQQSQKQQFMKINFFDQQPAHPGYQINDVNYIMPELQFQYRHARKLYIGNLPENIQVEQLVEFLWGAMQLAGGLLEPGNPIIHTDLFTTQKFLFLELRSIEETDAFLQLDGIIFAGKSLRFRRPKDYDKYPIVKGSRAVPQLNLNQIGLCAVPTVVSDGPNKLFIGGIPLDFDEGSVIQLLQLKEFGSLIGFHLVKDGKTNNSKGYAFLEYAEKEQADRCIQRLDGLHIMGRNLQCKRAEPTVAKSKFELNINYTDIMQYNSDYTGMPQMNINQPIMHQPNIIHPQNQQQEQYQQQQLQQQFGANANFVI